MALNFASRDIVDLSEAGSLPIRTAAHSPLRRSVYSHFLSEWLPTQLRSPLVVSQLVRGDPSPASTTMSGNIAFGRFDDSFSAASLKAYVAEFISTLVFVFAGVGSAIAYSEPVITIKC